MRVVVSSKQVRTAVRSDLRLPSYEYLPIDRWGGGLLPKAKGWPRANFGKKKKKKRGGGAHTSEIPVIIIN